MKPEILKDAVSEYIRELIEGYKSINPKFSIMEHVKNNGMNYDTWKAMMSGIQRWHLEYLILVAKSFSIPPGSFLAEIVRRYEIKSKT